jgi:hypothetical protein
LHISNGEKSRNEHRKPKRAVNHHSNNHGPGNDNRRIFYLFSCQVSMLVSKITA